MNSERSKTSKSLRVKRRRQTAMGRRWRWEKDTKVIVAPPSSSSVSDGNLPSVFACTQVVMEDPPPNIHPLL